MHLHVESGGTFQVLHGFLERSHFGNRSNGVACLISYWCRRNAVANPSMA